MKVPLDIRDNKVEDVMKLLNGLSYVKTKQLTEPKAKLIKEIREAVEEMKLIRAGKKKLVTQKTF